MKNLILFYMIILTSTLAAKGDYSIINRMESCVYVQDMEPGNMILTVNSIGEEEGWKPLFNGVNLKGWIVFQGTRTKGELSALDSKDQSVFTVEEGLIHFYKNFHEDSFVPEGFIATEQQYGNYRLKLEFKWGKKKFAQRAAKKRNSGVMLLAQDTSGFWPTSVECQVQEGDVGDIYTQNNAWITTTVDTFMVDPATENKIPVYSPAGREYNHGGAGSRRMIHVARYDNSEGWNSVEIIVKGNEATFIVNGKVTGRMWNIRYINPMNPADKKPLTGGRILLQAEASEIFYRNIMIKEE